MADIRATQGYVLATGLPSPDIRVTVSYSLVAYNVSTASMRATQLRTDLAVMPSAPIDVTQSYALVAVLGRPDNTKIRAWTFSLDGHDFYILRLDDTETLVYDMTSQQWSKWTSPGEDHWRAWTGTNWLGMSSASVLGGAQSKIVAGDDTYGLLWTVNPEVGYDDHPETGEADPQAFNRKVMGGVPMRMRETKPIAAVYLLGSAGSPQVADATVTLRTSDDAGRTWIDHGSITVTPGDYSQEYAWRSIGLMKAPGKLFELSDTGATVRIDGLDIR